MPATATAKPILLDYNGDGIVVITPKDENRFILTCQAAATACKVVDEQMQFFEQLKKVLLQRLGMWLAEHDQEVRTAFLAPREGGLLFLVIRNGVQYDRDFTDALTELDRQIAGSSDLDLILLDVLALPSCSDAAADSFIASGSGPRMVFQRAM